MIDFTVPTDLHFEDVFLVGQEVRYFFCLCGLQTVFKLAVRGDVIESFVLR